MNLSGTPNTIEAAASELMYSEYFMFQVYKSNLEISFGNLRNFEFHKIFYGNQPLKKRFYGLR